MKGWETTRRSKEWEVSEGAWARLQGKIERCLLAPKWVGNSGIKKCSRRDFCTCLKMWCKPSFPLDSCRESLVVWAMLCCVYVCVHALWGMWIDADFCVLSDSMQKQKHHLRAGHLGQKRPEAVGSWQVSGLPQVVIIGNGAGRECSLKEFLLEQKDRENFSLHLHFLSFCYSWAFRKVLFKHSSMVSSGRTD